MQGTIYFNNSCFEFRLNATTICKCQWSDAVAVKVDVKRKFIVRLISKEGRQVKLELESRHNVYNVFLWDMRRSTHARFDWRYWAVHLGRSRKYHITTIKEALDAQAIV